MKLINKTHDPIVTWDVYIAEYARHYPNFLWGGHLYVLENAETGKAVRVDIGIVASTFHPVHEVIPVEIESVEYEIVTRGEHI